VAHAPFRPSQASKKIELFISSYVSKSSAKGLVVGLSGGLDSSVVAKLAANALGPDRVLGLVMPADVTPDQDVEDAIALANGLGIRHILIRIEPLIRAFMQVLPENERAAGNLAARIRMSIMYYYAALEGYLVAGTSDKSERAIGFFTKFGDGAADILPIADLYKTQVRSLASHLEIPAEIIEKKSSPRLWKDHLAEDEIGLAYTQIDPIIALLLDGGKSPEQVARKLKVPLAIVKKVKAMVQHNSHKRRPTPFAKLV
jgi:NAD+ synthase